ncbi:DODA-type extradiol aromatic ring-opening family dioxygenase [Alkalimarinus coralli]|uniref:DODA-type extradiol aromatic ring-opening family dioxygenase n=1 Tax=Alkalimarinus coralli TaxID=2935863 RepID=UPI00202B9F59|nr:class III extradiol ring-cleavage dioxygenase [Alkalimarinus coralli]
MTDVAEKSSPVLFIPHGGGPMPLFDHKGHQELVSFLKSIPAQLGAPSAIILISAHWEEGKVTITGGESPELIYDYYGFPKDAYDVKYPAPGHTVLAERVNDLLKHHNIESDIDYERGFDHGMYVPLKLMYPEASIPCIQLSLINNLNPKQHIEIGKALAKLRKENVLIIGSGFSFHNLDAFRSINGGSNDSKNEAFEQWLIDTCTDKMFSPVEREQRLTGWSDAPHARYCHPREEHLLPLHVCYGLAGTEAKLVFEGTVLGKKASAFLW